ncbi:hypothetical protein [Enterobacter cloacae]
MYLDGKGVEKNEQKARLLFQKSCTGGSSLACDKLNNRN